MSFAKKDKGKMEEDILKYEEDIYYSPRYYDDEYEYRHVNVPKQIGKASFNCSKMDARGFYFLNTGRLMSEQEWRSFGVKQSPGWVHYMIHNPEPHILMFRREKNYQEKYPNGVQAKTGGLVG